MRREWAKRYHLSNKVLYELFSEFVSMIKISTQRTIDHSTEDILLEVLPIPENQKMSKYFKE
jgi:hypothetical protein